MKKSHTRAVLEMLIVVSLLAILSAAAILWLYPAQFSEDTDYYLYSSNSVFEVVSARLEPGDRHLVHFSRLASRPMYPWRQEVSFEVCLSNKTSVGYECNLEAFLADVTGETEIVPTLDLFGPHECKTARWTTWVYLRGVQTVRRIGIFVSPEPVTGLLFTASNPMVEP